MQAVKALYKEGKIQLLEPLKGITEAELFIIVLDKAEPTANRSLPTTHSEQDFKTLGLGSFFDTNEDNNVDWEDMFDVKPR